MPIRRHSPTEAEFVRLLGIEFRSQPSPAGRGPPTGQTLGRNASAPDRRGGGRAGLLRTLADAALAAGSEGAGVILLAMVAREWAHQGLTRLPIVKPLHERKAMMAGLADAFVALSGGIRTMEEFFGTWTWSQLGPRHKPIGPLNAAVSLDSLARFLAGLVREQYQGNDAIKIRLRNYNGGIRKFPLPQRTKPPFFSPGQDGWGSSVAV